MIGESELNDSGIHSDLVEEDDDSAPKSRWESSVCLIHERIRIRPVHFPHILTLHCF